MFLTHVTFYLRATVGDPGATHPADTWDFSAGDVWYFPPNSPHAIAGLAPSGCTFVTGYNEGSFNELDSFSASSWFATVPADILAQGLGISLAAAKTMLANNPGKNATFMPVGKLADINNQTATLPSQFPKQIHRFPLFSNLPEVRRLMLLATSKRIMHLHASAQNAPSNCVDCQQSVLSACMLLTSSVTLLLRKILLFNVQVILFLACSSATVHNHDPVPDNPVQCLSAGIETRWQHHQHD